MSTSSQSLQLAHGLDDLGIPLDGTAQGKLLAYLALLAKWNKVYALTALRDQDKAVSHHLLDSLAILPFVDALAPANVLDVGSGGGQPGIPLAIARPGLAVTLLDSNSKKVAFLKQAAMELPLPGLEAQCLRVEAWQPEQKFAAITSRAFAEVADFVSLTRHLLAPGGRWLAMKGIYPQEELSRLPAGIVVEAVHPLVVPGVEGARHLVVLREE
jgi:16S rRNA (guanine527-N7)-methyltransferase